MIDFCNYKWTNVMEGNRIIHPLYPYQYYGIEDTVMVGENGVMELKVKDNPREVKYWDGTVYNPKWEVPLLKSVESFSYGTFSIEAQLPEGRGLWASLWLTGRDVWPPEIDILEGETNHVGQGSYFRMFQTRFPHVWPTYRTTTNVHYRINGEKQNIGQKNVSVFSIKYPTDDYIKYECEWTPESITIRYDGKIVRKITDSNIIGFFNEHPHMHFVIDVFLDGNRDCLQTTPMKVRDFRYVEFLKENKTTLNNIIMKKEIKEEAVVVDYKKVLVELFEKVELSQPRTLVLTARPDDGTSLKPVTHLKEQANLALGSLFGRTVYDVNVWMCPKERTLFRRGVTLDTYVTAAFGSIAIAKQAYKDLKSLFEQ